MARLDTQLEAKGAEHLVLGNLLVERVPSYLAYERMRGYDIVSVWPPTNRSARIQVKSRWATDATSHLVKSVDCDFLVLVRLNRGNRSSSLRKRQGPAARREPQFFVLPADVARENLDQSGWGKIRWSENRYIGFEARWDLIRTFLGATEVGVDLSTSLADSQG